MKNKIWKKIQNQNGKARVTIMRGILVDDDYYE